jgi:hypothetical protein
MFAALFLVIATFCILKALKPKLTNMAAALFVAITTPLYAGRQFKLKAARNPRLRAALEQEAA